MDLLRSTTLQKNHYRECVISGVVKYFFNTFILYFILNTSILFGFLCSMLEKGLEWHIRKPIKYIFCGQPVTKSCERN